MRPILSMSRSLLVAALLLPGLAAAQTAAPPEVTPAPPAADTEEGERIVVTGARARSHTVFDSTVPVDVYAGPELQNALVTGEVGQALQELSPSIDMPRESASGTSDTIRVIQLRGLPPDEVLVLIDGKRVHTTAVPDTEGIFQGTVPVDLNTLPPGAIDHIEVLRDGAGAQYGSDAIAGVVNIVLRHDANGGDVYGSFGTNDTAFAPTHKRIIDGQTGTFGASDGFGIGNGGFLRFGFDGTATAGTNRAGPSNAAYTSYFDTPADQALDGRILFKSGDPAQQNAYAWYNGVLPLGGGAEAYSFATYNFRHAEGAAFFRYPGDPTNDILIHPEGYRPSTTANAFDINFVAGIRNRAADPWTWDVSVTQGDDFYGYGVVNSLNASLGDASPTRFHLADFEYHQTELNADITRSFTPRFLPAPVDFAAGIDVMHQIYGTGPGDPASYAAGPVTGSPPGAQAGPGLRPSDTVSLSRDIGEAYAEVETDLLPRLHADAAGRVSDYGDFGAATTGKISASYRLTQDLLLRGSVSNSFRAPALAQEGFRFATLNFNANGTGLQNNVLLPATDPLARAFGARPLRPETSRNYTAGLAWKLPRRTLFTVDGYYIEVSNRITRSSDLQSPAVTAYLQSIGQTDVQSVAFLTNALDTTNRGVDFTLSHDEPVGDGVLHLSGAANLNHVHFDRVRNTSPALALIDPTLTLIDPGNLLRDRAGSPGTKLILSTTWSDPVWTLLARATRYGSLYNQSFEPTAPLKDGTNAQYFGPKWVIDLEASAHLTPAWTASAGADNLFDVYPTRTIQTLNGTYGGALPYDPIDPVGINGAYYYVALRYAF